MECVLIAPLAKGALECHAEEHQCPVAETDRASRRLQKDLCL